MKVKSYIIVLTVILIQVLVFGQADKNFKIIEKLRIDTPYSLQNKFMKMYYDSAFNRIIPLVRIT